MTAYRCEPDAAGDDLIWRVEGDTYTPVLARYQLRHEEDWQRIVAALCEDTP